MGKHVRLSVRRFEPAGVVAAITPYNFPFVTNVWKVVPALLAGCTVVLRPSPLTPLSATVFGEAAEEAGLPPGVLNVVPEAGNDGAVLLSSHGAVDLLSFTGSTSVGRAIADAVAGVAATLIGPLISAGQRDRVHGIVTDEVAAGGRLVTGGKAPEAMGRGWYYEPTVLDSPSNTNPSAQREIFGPVLTVLGYGSVEEAVAIANDHELGLSGGVYTDDLAQGLAVAECIRSGTVQVNTGWASGQTPMGGYKQSGYGRERGAPGIRAFQELKHVVIGSR